MRIPHQFGGAGPGCLEDVACRLVGLTARSPRLQKLLVCAAMTYDDDEDRWEEQHVSVYD